MLLLRNRRVFRIEPGTRFMAHGIDTRALISSDPTLIATVNARRHREKRAWRWPLRLPCRRV